MNPFPSDRLNKTAKSGSKLQIGGVIGPIRISLDGGVVSTEAISFMPQKSFFMPATPRNRDKPIKIGCLPANNLTIRSSLYGVTSPSYF